MLFVMFSASVLSYTLKPFRRIPQIFQKILRRNRQKSLQIPSGPGNDPLWLTLFVEGVNDRLLNHCQVSSVPHYCAFKEQEIPTIYTVWMAIYWNSNVNILIFWHFTFTF